MAKWQGQRVQISEWNEALFTIYPGMGDELEVSPLHIMLHEAEMQAWVKDPRGMDKHFEPDLLRPGKFKVRTILGRR